jgi:hypothetical protein
MSTHSNRDRTQKQPRGGTIGNSPSLRRERRKKSSSAPQLNELKPAELLDPAEILKRFKSAAEVALRSEALLKDEEPLPKEIASALRQAVLEAFSSREQHTAQLATLHRLMVNKGNFSTIKNMTDRQLREAGVEVVQNPGRAELFILQDGEGDQLLVTQPAYVDAAQGRLILAGRLQRFAGKSATDSEAGKKAQESLKNSTDIQGNE